MSWTVENYDALAEAGLQHILLVGQALLISLAISLPLGIWSSRNRLVYRVAMVVTGILYTVPALALFALLIPLMGLGQGPALVAIVLYSLLVLTRNVAIGLREVPADIVEAADGMGYGSWRRLFLIELPLAAPVIVAGIRLTVVTQVSVATVGRSSGPVASATSSSRESRRISARRSSWARSRPRRWRSSPTKRCDGWSAGSKAAA
jgi:osmoprotectant transport system permease protein